MAHFPSPYDSEKFDHARARDNDPCDYDSNADAVSRFSKASVSTTASAEQQSKDEDLENQQQIESQPLIDTDTDTDTDSGSANTNNNSRSSHSDQYDAGSSCGSDSDSEQISLLGVDSPQFQEDPLQSDWKMSDEALQHLDLEAGRTLDSGMQMANIDQKKHTNSCSCACSCGVITFASVTAAVVVIIVATCIVVCCACGIWCFDNANASAPTGNDNEKGKLRQTGGGDEEQKQKQQGLESTGDEHDAGEVEKKSGQVLQWKQIQGQTQSSLTQNQKHKEKVVIRKKKDAKTNKHKNPNQDQQRLQEQANKKLDFSKNKKSKLASGRKLLKHGANAEKNPQEEKNQTIVPPKLQRLKQKTKREINQEQRNECQIDIESKNQKVVNLKNEQQTQQGNPRKVKDVPYPLLTGEDKKRQDELITFCRERINEVSSLIKIFEKRQKRIESLIEAKQKMRMPYDEQRLLDEVEKLLKRGRIQKLKPIPKPECLTEGVEREILTLREQVIEQLEKEEDLSRKVWMEKNSKSDDEDEDEDSQSDEDEDSQSDDDDEWRYELKDWLYRKGPFSAEVEKRLNAKLTELKDQDWEKYENLYKAYEWESQWQQDKINQRIQEAVEDQRKEKLIETILKDEKFKELLKVVEDSKSKAKIASKKAQKDWYYTGYQYPTGVEVEVHPKEGPFGSSQIERYYSKYYIANDFDSLTQEEHINEFFAKDKMLQLRNKLQGEIAALQSLKSISKADFEQVMGKWFTIDGMLEKWKDDLLNKFSDEEIDLAITIFDKVRKNGKAMKSVRKFQAAVKAWRVALENAKKYMQSFSVPT